MKYQKILIKLAKFILKFFKILPQFGWLVEKELFEQKLTLGFISLTFLNAERTKFEPTFVKTLIEIWR